MESDVHYAVRPMQLLDVDMRIRYFHEASDEHLQRLGVGRELLPSAADWYSTYELDFAKPLRERMSFGLVWELDGTPVGFSTSDRIVFGSEAFMHLHLLHETDRRRGMGTEFVRLSSRAYFNALELERLFCEPNALNTAPNRTLQAAGFSYVSSQETTPSPINVWQTTTRWVLERDHLS